MKKLKNNSKKDEILKEFESLTDEQKQDAFEFILFLLFKRKLRFIENDKFGGNYYISVNDLIR